MNKIFIVIPTIRPDKILDFLEKWKEQFKDYSLIVVEDNPNKTFSLPDNIQHYCWQDIDSDLKDKSWIISRRSSAIRSYGFYKAYKQGADIIITLDDDCQPYDYLDSYINYLNMTIFDNAWEYTCNIPTRGVPYFNKNREMKCVLNHGLWTGDPDLDAIQQLTKNKNIELIDKIIPRGKYFPMCGMNLVFASEITPLMYFPLMGEGQPYDRYDDIWCGLFAKKILDHLGLGVHSGHPFVYHNRASDVWKNLIQESSGYKINEILWHTVDDIILTKDNPIDCYIELAQKLPGCNEYFINLKKAMAIWAELFI